ncbi:DNA polymerase III subunit delta' [Thiopseudomonas acetoxidans]|uniref:DNA polymerase III subunit delta' n=1 Tax=Thiopseudomonas acetoxidans TaxID=3041622 RepID=A0ABT7SP32_9GAMM|nr:DNA polymerase III subunit delta' [Thiopseudomonas sp. CY1220]MDM7857941.1 DNA polymerase III subunit delta' [Thiopseudomonas sp. CY1220]
MVDILPWQQDIWQGLIGRTQHAHAYLLHGPAGSGKRQMAELFARFLLCKQPQAAQACGQCRSCKLYAADSHPDMLRVEPEEPGKGILIAYVRELVASIQQTAQQGGRQVVILEPAEVMTLESANALLKSLEEPSAGTVFLLITHQLSFLLPTIKSRCVLQACPLPDLAQAKTWLAQQLPSLDDTQLTKLLQLSGGSPLKAQQFAEDNVLQMRADVVEGVKQLLKRQLAPAQLAGQWTKLPTVLLLDWFAQWCQNILRYQLTQNTVDLGLQDMQPVLGHMAKFVQAEQLTETHSWILERRNKLLRRAPLRADLLLESLLVRWMGLIGF